MELTVTTAEGNPNVKVVRPVGHLDGVTSDAAAPKVMEALDQSAAGLILDLGAMDFISSAGLRVLLHLRQKAQADGKQLAVVRVLPPVYKIFKIMSLDNVFRFFDEEADAIQALWPTA
jgi:anti-anti-sigma factor